MTPLGALIEERKAQFLDETGVALTNGDIARRARGGGLTRTRVQQLASNPMSKPPAPETLRALALGLGVPYSVVLQRALQSTGYLQPDLTTTTSASTAGPASEAPTQAQFDREARATLSALPEGSPGSPVDVTVAPESQTRQIP